MIIARREAAARRGGGNALHCTQKTNNPQWPQRNFVGTYRAEHYVAFCIEGVLVPAFPGVLK